MTDRTAGQQSRAASQSLIDDFSGLKEENKYLAFTGRGDADNTVLVDGRPGFIFVRIPKKVVTGTLEEYSEAQAFSAQEYRANVPVFVVKSKQNPSRYEVQDIWSVGSGQAVLQSIGGSAQAHHYSHELYSAIGGDDPVMLDTIQLKNLQVVPLAPTSSKVRVNSGWYLNTDRTIDFFDGVEVELSDNVPTGTLNLNYVNLWLDPTDQSIVKTVVEGVGSATFSSPMSDMLRWPEDSFIPLAAVRLSPGNYRIDWTDGVVPTIIDLRPHQAFMPGDIAKIASGTLSRVEQDYVTQSVNPSILNFVGGLTVDDEGTGRVTVTGTFGVTVALQEDDVEQVATADTINFEGDGAFVDFVVIDEGGNKGTVSGTFDETEIRHEALNFLTNNDDHTQYALLTGRAGGQTLVGGVGAGENLTLQSTSHLTKGSIILGSASAYDEVNDRLGMGDLTPDAKLDIEVATANEPGLIVQTTDDDATNNLLEAQDSGGDNLFAIGATGILTISASALKFGTIVHTAGDVLSIKSTGSILFAAEGTNESFRVTDDGNETIFQATNNDWVIQWFRANTDTQTLEFKGVNSEGTTTFMTLSGHDGATNDNALIALHHSTLVEAPAATKIPLIVKGAAAQSANLLELQESDGSIFLASGDGLANSEFVINEQGEDIDFRVESDNETHMLFVDAGSDSMAVGGDEVDATVAGTLFGAKFMVHTEGGTDLLGIAEHRHSDTVGFGAHFVLARSRGTDASESAVADDDMIGRLAFLGHDGTDYNLAAQIDVEIDGTVASNDMPGRMLFLTTPTGSNVPVERMRIDNAGLVGIGATSIGHTLAVGGEVRVTAASANITTLEVIGTTISGLAASISQTVQSSLEGQIGVKLDTVLEPGAALTDIHAVTMRGLLDNVSNDITNVYGLLLHMHEGFSYSGTVTNLYVLNIAASDALTDPTNLYGLWIGDQNDGSNNWSIFTNAGLVHFGDQAEIIGSVAASVQLTIRGATSQTANLLELQEQDASIFVASGDGLAGSEFVINDQQEDIDFRVEGDADNDLFHTDANVDAIGIGIAAPLAKLHIDQLSTTGAKPVLTLDQADVDEDYFKFIGISDTNVDRALVDAANFTTPGAIVGWLKINVQDNQGTDPITDGDYYIPFYAAPSA